MGRSIPEENIRDLINNAGPISENGTFNFFVKIKQEGEKNFNVTMFEAEAVQNKMSLLY